MAAVFTLALGIAANTIAFTLLNALVLRPMPVPAAHRVVRVYPIDATGRRHNLFSSADAHDYRAQAPGFDVLAAYVPSDVTVGRSSRDTADVEPRPAVAYVVSQGYFDLVGFRPALGRLLEAADERGGSVQPVVISYGMWKGRFASDPGILGGTIAVNGRPFTIVGVGPSTFAGTEPLVPDLWVPISAQPVVAPGEGSLEDRDIEWLLLVGRLSSGVTRRAVAGQSQRDRPTAVRGLSGRKSTAGGRGRRRHLLHAGSGREAGDCGGDGHRRSRAADRVRQRREPDAGQGRVDGSARSPCAWRSARAGGTSCAGCSWKRCSSACWPVASRCCCPNGRCACCMRLARSSLHIRGRLRSTSRRTGASSRTRFSSPSQAARSLVSSRPFRRRRCGSPRRCTKMRRFLGLRVSRSRVRNGLVIAQISCSLVLLITAALLTRGLQHARALDLGFTASDVLYAEYDLEKAGYTKERAAQFSQQLARARRSDRRCGGDWADVARAAAWRRQADGGPARRRGRTGAILRSPPCTRSRLRSISRFSGFRSPRAAISTATTCLVGHRPPSSARGSRADSGRRRIRLAGPCA